MELLTSESFKVKIDCISDKQFSKDITENPDKLLLHFKDNKYQEIIHFFKQDWFKIQNYWDIDKELLEFKRFVDMFRGVNFTPIPLTIFKSDVDNKKHYYTHPLGSDSYEFKSLTEMIDTMGDYDGSLLVNSNIFNGIFNYDNNGNYSDGASILGITPKIYADKIYPYAAGYKDGEVLPVVEDKLNAKVLIVIPGEFKSEIKDLKIWFNNYIHNKWMVGMRQDLFLKYSNAMINAAERGLMDKKGKVDWKSWPPVASWLLKSGLSFDKYYEFCKTDDVLLSHAQNKGIADKLNKMSFEELYNNYKNLYVSWKDYYNGEISGKEFDSYDGIQKQIKLHIDEEFKRDIFDEYPYLDKFVSLRTYGGNWELFYECEDKEVLDLEQEANTLYFELYRWLYGYPGTIKFVDAFGGEKEFPTAYVRPDKYNRISTKPSKIWIQDYKGEEKKIEDFGEYKWINEHKALLDEVNNKITDKSFKAQELWQKRSNYSF